MPFAAETSASGAVEAWTSAPAGEAVIIALAIICRHICVWFLRGGVVVVTVRSQRASGGASGGE